MLPVMVMVGITPDADVSKMKDQRVASSPRAYEKTADASPIRDAGSGKTRQPALARIDTIRWSDPDC